MGEGRFSPTLGDAKQFHFQMPEGQRGGGCKINQQHLHAPGSGNCSRPDDVSLVHRDDEALPLRL